MSTIQYPDGSVKQVKNLGWLLRNWKRVKDFEVMRNPDDRNDCLLIAHMDDKSMYVTDYADKTVLKRFLDRPVFRGLEITWNGINGVIGSDYYWNYLGI